MSVKTSDHYTAGFAFQGGKWTKANFLKANAHATPEAIQQAMQAGERIMVPTWFASEAGKIVAVPVPGYDPDYLFD